MQIWILSRRVPLEQLADSAILSLLNPEERYLLPLYHLQWHPTIRTSIRSATTSLRFRLHLLILLLEQLEAVWVEIPLFLKRVPAMEFSWDRLQILQMLVCLRVVWLHRLLEALSGTIYFASPLALAAAAMGFLVEIQDLLLYAFTFYVENVLLVPHVVLRIFNFFFSISGKQMLDFFFYSVSKFYSFFIIVLNQFY